LLLTNPLTTIFIGKIIVKGPFNNDFYLKTFVKRTL
jgi:hypothetical protein